MSQPEFRIAAKIGDQPRTIVKRTVGSPKLVGNVMHIDLLGLDVTGVDFSQDVVVMLTLRRNA